MPRPGEPASDQDDAVGLARFLTRAGRLKRVKRTGWLDRGVPAAETESVADHTFRVALLAWLAAEAAAAGGEPIDPARVLRLALLHDLAEALTGDLTPYDPAAIPDAADDEARAAFLNRRHDRDPGRATAKRAAEAAAMETLAATLPEASSRVFRALAVELAGGATPEARLVKQADKLETYLQSREYAARYPGLPVASFALEIADALTEPGLVALREAIAKTGIEDSGGSVGSPTKAGRWQGQTSPVPVPDGERGMG